jgi:hypothetical protein
MVNFVVNLTRGPVEGIQCTSSYVEKTSHTCSLNFLLEFTGLAEGEQNLNHKKKESRSENERSFLFYMGKKTYTQFLSLTGAP